MAIDLQTVLPQELIPITRTRLVVVGGYKALEVLGDDFRTVDEVQINGVVSQDVVITSKNRLVAQLPPELQENPVLSSVAVLSRSIYASDRSVLRFKLGDTPNGVTGVNRLLQLFVKLLLSDPGSDIFNKSAGGGALRSVGATFDYNDSQAIKANFIIAVDKVARQITSTQGRNTSLPADERLLRAELTGAIFSEENGTLYVTIKITSQQGNTAGVSLEV